jgi:hypothetical protein
MLLNADIAVALRCQFSDLLCQGSTAVPLTATASPGNTLRWYTAATGGTLAAQLPLP